MALAIALCAISFGASQNNQHQLFSNHDQEDPIIFDESNFSFYLGTAHSSWVFRVLYGQLQHFHWGPKTDPNDPLIYLNDECDIVSFDAGLKNSQMLEYPNEGSGDFRIPAFRLKYHDGYTVSNFTYSSHIIIRGPIENYHPSTPHARPRGNKDWTLIIRLEDKKYGIELELSYTIFYEFDTVARGVRLRNLSNQTIVLEEINSVASDFPSTTGSEQYHITHLAGAWARERQVITRPIQMGVSSFESRRGASSHQHNPFLILTKG